MSQYFSERYGGDINLKVDLSNYATKKILKKQQDLIHLI